MSTSISLKVSLKVDAAPMVGEDHGNPVSVVQEDDGHTVVATCTNFTGDVRITLIQAIDLIPAIESLSLEVLEVLEPAGLARDEVIEESPRSAGVLQASSSDEEESVEAPPKAATKFPTARRHVGFVRTTRAASRRSEQAPVSAVTIPSDTEGEEDVDDDLSDAFQETQED
jgi:hypothetical protein